jgi:hypothetical protein
LLDREHRREFLHSLYPPLEGVGGCFPSRYTSNVRGIGLGLALGPFRRLGASSLYLLPVKIL